MRHAIDHYCSFSGNYLGSTITTDPTLSFAKIPEINDGFHSLLDFYTPTTLLLEEISKRDLEIAVEDLSDYFENYIP